MGGRAGRDEQVEVVVRSRPADRSRPAREPPRARRPAGPDGPRAARGSRPRTASQSSVDGALLADHHPRVAGGRDLREGVAAAARRGRRSRRRGRAPAAARRDSTAVKRPSPRRATSSRKTRSTGSSAQNARIWSSSGSFNVGIGGRNFRLSLVPIHVRAEPGDYAEACLLPGDPLRAQYIAETYLDNPVQRNAERGMLGYTGDVRGPARSRCRRRAWAAPRRRS